jgi:hypothetical protein
VAKQAIYGSQLTPEQMNGDESYRVKYSCGTFSITPKSTPSGVYWSVVKRFRGKLYKVYIGKSGGIERHAVQSACVRLLAKIQAETGAMFARDKRSRNSYP